MEWCGKLYVGGNPEKYIRRLSEFLAVILLLCLLLGEAEGAESAVMLNTIADRENKTPYRTDVSEVETEEGFGMIYKNTAVPLYISGAAGICTALAGLPAEAVKDPEPVLRETEGERFPVSVKESGKTAGPLPAAENAIAGNSSADILTAPEEIPEPSGSLKDETDNITAALPDETPEDVPAEPEDIPADSAEPSLPGPQTDMIVEGFLVDENGAICGIADPETAVQGGRLILPSEDCTAIARDAFLSAPEGIREVHIPSNITDIAEGAFAGLSQLEWFSVESSGNFVSRDGVLFTDGGTCLLAFPPARIGIYSVPSDVIRFAEDAFAGALIRKVDARGCSLEDAGNVPEEIEILRRP